ncbi:MAG: ABC transporter permease [Saprospiraceae bacterium]|nr:ABC transporter permease [Saprospiraceae bacterium]
MNKMKYILRKEFKQIFRDPAILRLIFLMPAIQLLILPFAADYEIKNINVGIVDHDHSTYSRGLIQKIEFSSYFNLTEYSDSYQMGLQWIESETADLIIEIPTNFEKNLVRESEATLFLAVNAVNGPKGNLGAAYASNIIRSYNQDIRSEWIQWPRMNPEPQIEVVASHWYNPTSNYQVFMVPGILAVLLTMVGGFLSALNIVREKEIGTIEQLNVSPIKKHQFILGKLIPFWLLGFVVLTIGLMISYVIHGIIPGPNLGTLYLFSGIYLLAILGFGLLVSNFTDTQQQALMVAFFFMLIFILLSGLYTPIESMPKWAQIVAWINPVTYLVDVCRMVMLKGSVLSDMTFHLVAIGFTGVLLNTLAIWTYAKRT